MGMEAGEGALLRLGFSSVGLPDKAEVGGWSWA